MRISRLASLSLLGLSVAGGSLAAQATSAVRVRIIDSTGAPISGVEVTVTRGLRDVVARGVTDDAGARVLFFPAVEADLEVAARKIGFTKGNRLVHMTHADTVTLGLQLRAVPRSLDTVTVTAQAPRKRNVIDAEEIAASNKTIRNGWDVVSKLRPDMLRMSDIGPIGRRDTEAPRCGGAVNVFLNGSRIILPPRPRPQDMQHAQANAPLAARYSANVVAVLSDIHPEHIEEIKYHDCFDNSVQEQGATNALFITLKPGVMYEAGVETFVLPTPKPAEGERR